MKITTHGQVAFAWFKDKRERMEQTRIPIGEFLKGFVWEGNFNRMPDSVARKVAPLHPDFMRYYEDAMAILWSFSYKGKNAGTEDPKWAIRNSSKPSEFKYVVIWEPITHGG